MERQLVAVWFGVVADAHLGALLNQPIEGPSHSGALIGVAEQTQGAAGWACRNWLSGNCRGRSPLLVMKTLSRSLRSAVGTSVCKARPTLDLLRY